MAAKTLRIRLVNFDPKKWRDYRIVRVATPSDAAIDLPLDSEWRDGDEISLAKICDIGSECADYDYIKANPKTKLHRVGIWGGRTLFQDLLARSIYIELEK